MAGLRTSIDSMGGDLTCLSYQASRCELPLRPHPNYPPHAAAVQMQLPPASAARRLRLRPGQMAVLVTVTFADAAGSRPAALTAAMLRPDMFRITVQAAPGGPGGADLDAAWPPAIWDHGQ